MAISISPERLARFSTRRPWVVVGIWIVLLLVGMASAATIGDVLTTSVENYQDTESRTAGDLLSANLYGELPGRETIVVRSEARTVDDPAFQQVASGLVAQLRGLDGDVLTVVSYYETPAPGLVSKDGRTLLIPVTLAGGQQEAAGHVDGLTTLTARLDGVDGFTVVAGGDGTAAKAFDEQSQKDLEKSEVLGLPIALVVLVLVFGALVAAGLPILLGIVSIIIAVGISAMIGRTVELSVFVVNITTMMGLAVGIDYCLLIIQRFREERANGLERDEAIIRVGATASRAVLFSGLAVVAALAGMLLVPNSVFRSLSVGAMVVVLVAVAAALTLLPAVLRLLGDRVNAGRLRLPGRTRVKKAESETFWYRAAGVVMRHPSISVVLSVLLLVAAAAPYLTIKFGWAGVSSLPASVEARRAVDILNQEFSAGVISPVEIVVTAANVEDPSVTGAVDTLLATLQADDAFGAPPAVEINPSKSLLLIRIPTAVDPQSSAAQAAVRRLRDSYLPRAFGETAARPLVTGATATGIDDTGIITGHTLPVFAFVLGLSFVILLLVFRSIVVPLKALVMNVLSVGAAYGLMVTVFQHGVGNELFGFAQIERIESWVPLFMFSVLFGLSMDYHVFLLTRIRERFTHTGDNAESVRHGVASTAGMITGAAAIMVAIFAGFASGELVAFQQMGFGLGVAVLLDATIVRVVLVPASMQLLGDRNWYFPTWLRWLPVIDVEGSTTETPAAGRKEIGGRVSVPAMSVME